MRSMLPAPEAREAVLSFYEKIGRSGDAGSA
mgnify:FL=1